MHVLDRPGSLLVIGIGCEPLVETGELYDDIFDGADSLTKWSKAQGLTSESRLEFYVSVPPKIRGIGIPGMRL